MGMVDWKGWLGAMVHGHLSNLQSPTPMDSRFREGAETANGRILFRKWSHLFLDPFHLNRILCCPELGVTLALWDWYSTGKLWANNLGGKW